MKKACVLSRHRKSLKFGRTSSYMLGFLLMIRVFAKTSQSETLLSGTGGWGIELTTQKYPSTHIKIALNGRMFSRVLILHWTMCVCVLLASHGLSSEISTSMLAECDENVTLPCFARQQNHQYRAVTWYKEREVDGTRAGILRKSDNDVMPYNNSKTAKFGVNESLVLLGVRPQDSGNYLCFLSAQIGHTNKESTLHLNVSECVAPAVPTVFPVATNSYQPGTEQTEVPVAWIISGFSAVGLVKVVLCFTFLQASLIINRRLVRSKPPE